ncbi:predicted protein [Streptomyces viridosporus ATCC 14672]|uniref:Predicted protein n=1 Tax=Streptomyces viridosporus (strain ATCC 14672 / DSM 40746 / JCM 4963 / KCTC 9882 / NRRL B-12104 / FH 1290) TaxID=566461 RepID=D5ZT02_STRV1|nr:predicted protein [Streptomyces viridosporus ATCC 14672]
MPASSPVALRHRALTSGTPLTPSRFPAPRQFLPRRSRTPGAGADHRVGAGPRPVAAAPIRGVPVLIAPPDLAVITRMSAPGRRVVAL